MDAPSRCLFITGIWDSAKVKVIGITPHTLKDTQNSSEKLRQITSLSTARKAKNSAQLRVSLNQPASSMGGNAISNRVFSSGRFIARPMSRVTEKMLLTMVGFSLMNSSSCRYSVSPPITATTPPDTHSMGGMCPTSRQEAIMDAAMATMKAAVAANRSIRK